MIARPIVTSVSRIYTQFEQKHVFTCVLLKIWKSNKKAFSKKSNLTQVWLSSFKNCFIKISHLDLLARTALSNEITIRIAQRAKRIQRASHTVKQCAETMRRRKRRYRVTMWTMDRWPRGETKRRVNKVCGRCERKVEHEAKVCLKIVITVKRKSLKFIKVWFSLSDLIKYTFLSEWHIIFTDNATINSNIFLTLKIKKFIFYT